MEKLLKFTIICYQIFDLKGLFLDFPLSLFPVLFVIDEIPCFMFDPC